MPESGLTPEDLDQARELLSGAETARSDDDAVTLLAAAINAERRSHAPDAISDADLLSAQHVVHQFTPAPGSGCAWVTRRGPAGQGHRASSGRLRRPLVVVVASTGPRALPGLPQHTVIAALLGHARKAVPVSVPRVSSARDR
jgi:hypothetical protein